MIILQCIRPCVKVRTHIVCYGIYISCECLKQHSVHPHKEGHQLGSARHRVFRSSKPRTLSGRRISSDHMITTPHWMASSSPGLFSTIANWVLFLQLVRALNCSSTLSSYNVRELNVVHTDCAGKLRQRTSTRNSQVGHPRSLHRVCRSVYAAFPIHMRYGTFPPNELSVPQ